jgi:SAM-dependent methyltransferase
MTVTSADRPTSSRLDAATLNLRRCPGCRGGLDRSADCLSCVRCRAVYPIRNDIPRFVGDDLDETAERTRQSFGYEWTQFRDWTASGATNFADYFGDLHLDSLAGFQVLDAGCGMGRHARMMAPHTGRLVAMDFSAAVDQAAQTLADCPQVTCIQGDLTRPPLADSSFDFVYSLGVLHHLDDTAGALSGLVRLAKPGGRVRVYLYWQPEGWRARLLALVNALRPLTTRLPFVVLKAFCYVVSVALWVAVVTPYRLLLAAGVERVGRMPLVQYVKYPFTILYNDQFDRFSAPLEKRYRADEVRQLLERCGLESVTVWPRFGWIAEGRRPGGA